MLILEVSFEGGWAVVLPMLTPGILFKGGGVLPMLTPGILFKDGGVLPILTPGILFNEGWAVVLPISIANF